MPPEPQSCTILVDGEALRVRVGASLAAALLGHGRAALAPSIGGQARGALCGMGSCYGCCVRVDGRPGVRACCTPCAPGMEVELDA